MKVLVEMGVEGGRAGCRTAGEALAVARAIEEASCLALAGVEGYEGAVPGDNFAERLAGVDRFFQQVRELACAIDRAGLFEGQEILVSAGGSIFFDRVVQELGSPWQLSRPVRVVIRPGSYVTHDADLYRRISPLDGRSSNGDRLQPALEILGLVLSRPEPGIAIAGIGRRDAPYDTRLPIPTRVWRTGTWSDVAGRMTVTQLNDQHAFLALDPEDDLRPGDVVACDISHPCTTFDKWRLIPLVDDDYQVTGAIKTFF